MSDTRSIPVKEALNAGWALTKKHFGVLLATIIILAIPVGVSAYIYLRPFTGSIYVDFLSVLLFLYLLGGSAKLSLAAVRGQNPSLGNLFSLSPLAYLNLILFLILYFILIPIGFFLLVIPGFIVLLMFFFGSYFIVDKQSGFLSSFGQSKRLTAGRKGTLFSWLIVQTLLLTLAAIPFGLGLLVFGPIIFLANAYIYDTLTKRDGIK